MPPYVKLEARLMPVPLVLLASTSRYRRELLERLRIPFTVCAPGVDETPRAGETAAALAERLALEKAWAVATDAPDALVIGSDQAADLDGRIIGKPGTDAAARMQLQAASGRSAVFCTAVALVHAATSRSWCERIDTRVVYRMLSDGEIDAYLDAEPALDCAGSAKVEGLGIALLDTVESTDPTALIGLPLIAVCRMLAAAGASPLDRNAAAAARSR